MPKLRLPTLSAGRFSFLVAGALITYFWWPAVWAKKVVLHGDSVLFGLPLLKLHARALHGTDHMLWASRLTGGHPLLAEGQAGFLNPLNAFVAYFFKPAYGIGIFHWLSMLVGAAGVYWLCRVLEIGRWAATFAGLAVALSGAWISEQHNLPISATIAWVPWLMAAIEFWLKQPTVGRALWMALPLPLLIFAGYPLITYGAVIYVASSVLVRVAWREDRRFVAEHWRGLLWTGALAAAVALGLSAIQLLPLVELIPHSHRSDGIRLSFAGLTGFGSVVRGFLYFYLGSERDGGNISNLGSAVVALCFGLALFVRLPARIAGHLLGGFVLFNLAMALNSPLFRLLYDHHLLPGLHSFRIVRPLFTIGVIGVAVVAAWALDQLARDRVTLWPWFQRSRLLLVLGGLGYAVGFVALARTFHAPVYAYAAVAAPLLLAAGSGLLAIAGRTRWLPLLALGALAFETFGVRSHVFVFHHERVLRRPELIRDVVRDPEIANYRALNTTAADAMTFKPVVDPGLPNMYERVRKSLSAFPTLDAGVASMDGALGLYLQRWSMVALEVRAELERVDPRPAGLRLLDVFAVRYVTATSKPAARHFSVFRRERLGGSITIYFNEAAKPRFQIYRDAVRASDAGDALARMRTATAPTIVLEDAYSGAQPELPASGACATWPNTAVPIDVAVANSMRYELRASVPCDAWLFLADANFPGWKAKVNGVDTPVYTAQVLGKAVKLPAGHNVVTFEFVPWSFYLGAALSSATLLAMAAYAALRWRRRREDKRAVRGPAPSREPLAADPPGAPIGDSP